MESETHNDAAYIRLSEARLVYWARIPGWRFREASALLLELDPDDPNIQGNSRFHDLQRVLLRARSMKLIHSPIKPKHFLEWAASNEIEIPARLQFEVLGQMEIINWRKLALRRERQLARSQSERPEPEINAKSKHTAEKFFLCMALRWYRIGDSLNFNFKKMLEDVTINDKAQISIEAIRDWMADAKERQSEILDEVTRALDGNPNRNL